MFFSPVLALGVDSVASLFYVGKDLFVSCLSDGSFVLDFFLGFDGELTDQFPHFILIDFRHFG